MAGPNLPFKDVPGRIGGDYTRVDDPVTKQQLEWLQTKLLARSNARFMIAGHKADLRNGWGPNRTIQRRSI